MIEDLWNKPTFFKIKYEPGSLLKYIVVNENQIGDLLSILLSNKRNDWLVSRNMWERNGKFLKCLKRKNVKRFCSLYT